MCDQQCALVSGEKTGGLIVACIAPRSLAVLGDKARGVGRRELDLSNMVKYPFDQTQIPDALRFADCQSGNKIGNGSSIDGDEIGMPNF